LLIPPSLFAVSLNFVSKCVLIALQYLALLALPENSNMVTKEENSDSGGHRETK